MCLHEAPGPLSAVIYQPLSWEQWTRRWRRKPLRLKRPNLTLKKIRSHHAKPVDDTIINSWPMILGWDGKGNKNEDTDAALIHFYAHVGYLRTILPIWWLIDRSAFPRPPVLDRASRVASEGNAELSRKLSLVAQRHHRLSTDQNSIGFAKSNRLSLVHHSTLDYCRRICANQGRKQYVGMIGQDLLSAALIKEKMVIRRKLMCRTLFSCSYIITDLAEAVQHGIISPQWSIKGAEVRRHLLTCISPEQDSGVDGT